MPLTTTIKDKNDPSLTTPASKKRRVESFVFDVDQDEVHPTTTFVAATPNCSKTMTAVAAPKSITPEEQETKTTTTRTCSQQPEEETSLLLNYEQQLAVDIAASGSNLFLTGPAGTGKSVVLKHVLKNLKQKYPPPSSSSSSSPKNTTTTANKSNDDVKKKKDPWVVVGPTGTTALALGGQTLHSFAGCGVPTIQKDFEKCWDRRDDWRALKVLVIDEISMISGEFWDRLSDVVSKIRRNRDDDDDNDDNNEEEESITDKGNDKQQQQKPFGGIQLIVCGDFLQLPPIPLRPHDYKQMVNTGKINRFQIHGNRGFAFQSQAWQTANFEVVELTQVYRQDQGKKFVEYLHQLRKGDVSPQAEQFFQACARPLPRPTTSDLKPTILYAKNVDVHRENELELNKLTGKSHEFTAFDSVSLDEDIEFAEAAERELRHNNHFWYQCPAAANLSLKVGAQVMLIKNEPLGGSSNNYRRLVNGSRGVVVGFTQVLPGDGTALTDTYLDYIQQTPKQSSTTTTTTTDKENTTTNNNKLWYPFVKFYNGSVRVVGAMTFSSRLAGLGTCSRVAIPLKLAYAITIHKSQGMTLDYVKADVGSVFTEAQTYVALSRASDENGLELKGFSKAVVKTHAEALAFYKNPAGPFSMWDANLVEHNENDDDPEAPPTLEPPAAIPGCLEGKSFVFTGEYHGNYSRTQAEQLVKDCGGAVKGAVSGKTNYLLIGDFLDDGREVTATQKYIKAHRIVAGIGGTPNKSSLKIIKLKEFFGLVRKPKKTKTTLAQFFSPR